MGDFDIDERGYPRGKDGKLIHRKVAYKDYKTKKSKYSQPFSKYQVHHKDGNKGNFRRSNLEIVTEKEHRKIHGISTIVDDSNVVIGAVSVAFSFIITFLICNLLINLNIIKDKGIYGERVFMIGIIIFFIVWFLFDKYFEEETRLFMGLALIGSGLVFTLSAFFTKDNFELSFLITSLFFIGCLIWIFYPRFKEKINTKDGFFKWVFSNIFYYIIPIIWFGYVYLPKYSLIRELPYELALFLIGSILLVAIISYLVLLIPFYVYWKIFKRK